MSLVLKALTYVVSILWTVWLLIVSVETSCFSIFDSYVTVIVLLVSMVLNDLLPIL